ncbi:MAG: RNA ligase (ATP), partial [Burkholderiales bacterium]
MRHHHAATEEPEVATVGGWRVVVKKGEFAVGDLAVYCEIDSWIPHDLAPFLSKGNEPKEYNGVKGERLRTIRLRGQLSQGLL